MCERFWTLPPYLQGTGTYQFQSPSAASQTTDTVTPGGFVEVGLKDPFIALARDYFRVHAGEQYGSSGISSTSVVGEWLPVYGNVFQQFAVGTPSYIPFAFSKPIVDYLFAPELMVQHDTLQIGPQKYLLFSTNNQAVRIGPEAVLKLWLDQTTVPLALQTAAQRTTLSVTYHASWDTYSGRNYSWLQTVFTYNLNDDGNIAASASFGYGNSETTANMTSQIKLGLAGKY